MLYSGGSSQSLKSPMASLAGFNQLTYDEACFHAVSQRRSFSFADVSTAGCGCLHPAQNSRLLGCLVGSPTLTFLRTCVSSRSRKGVRFFFLFFVGQEPRFQIDPWVPISRRQLFVTAACPTAEMDGPRSPCPMRWFLGPLKPRVNEASWLPFQTAGALSHFLGVL